MMEDNDNHESTSEEPAEVLLRQLLHLKRYEVPDPARMARNQQNIMRCVREASTRSRSSLSELIEVNIPWFFSEPRYGIAALFIVFATLQFWGVSAQKHERGKTDIYTRGGGMAVTGQGASAYTNNVTYPPIPDNLNYFPRQQQGDSSIKFVGRRAKPEE